MTLRATDAARLITCDPRLQDLVVALAKTWNIRVICGHRNKVEQDTAFSQGKSKLKWPLSNHNRLPSLAIDMVPMEANGAIDWNDVRRISYFAGHVMQKAKELGIRLRWGGDWDVDTELKDNTFNDLVHFEIIQ